MATKNNKKEEEIEPVMTKMLDQEGLKKFNDSNSIKNKIVPFLLIIVSILLFGSIYLNLLQFYKLKLKKYPECPVCSDNIIEKQKVNIEGYMFDFDNKWKISMADNNVNIINNDENISITLKIKDFSYEKLSDPDYLKVFLETFKSDENCFLDINREEEKNGVKYYYLEGTQNGYPFINIIVGKEGKTFSASAVFEDIDSLNNNKSSIIDLLINAYKNY